MQVAVHVADAVERSGLRHGVLCRDVEHQGSLVGLDRLVGVRRLEAGEKTHAVSVSKVVLGVGVGCREFGNGQERQRLPEGAQGQVQGGFRTVLFREPEIAQADLHGDPSLGFRLQIAVEGAQDVLVVFQGASVFAELIARLRAVHGFGDARLQGGLLARPQGVVDVIPDGPHGGSQTQQNHHRHNPRAPVQRPPYVRHDTRPPFSPPTVDNPQITDIRSAPP